MYSFAQNRDVVVIDEPLYGHYLRVTGAEHPGRDDVIAAMNCDGDAVMRELLVRQAENPEPRLFIKHMAHHLVDLDLGSAFSAKPAISFSFAIRATCCHRFRSSCPSPAWPIPGCADSGKYFPVCLMRARNRQSSIRGNY
jgi:hypothetical protein